MNINTGDIICVFEKHNSSEKELECLFAYSIVIKTEHLFSLCWTYILSGDIVPVAYNQNDLCNMLKNSYTTNFRYLHLPVNS